MITTPVKFPAICFCPKLLVFLVSSQRPLYSANRKALDVYYRDMLIVGADLKGYRVEQATTRGLAHPFCGLRLRPIPHILFSLDLTLRELPTRLTVEALVARLVAVFGCDQSDAWAAEGGAEDLLREVRCFTSAKDIFQWPFWRYHAIRSGLCL